MLHSVVCPSMGHAIVHNFGEGAAVWGQVITPSIAHLLQSERELPIDFSRVRPGIVFEVETAGALLPHVIDASTLRVHVGTTAYRHAAGRGDATVEAVVRIDVGGDCTLKVWGSTTAENPSPHVPASIQERASTTPDNLQGNILGNLAGKRCPFRSVAACIGRKGSGDPAASGSGRSCDVLTIGSQQPSTTS